MKVVPVVCQSVWQGRGADYIGERNSLGSAPDSALSCSFLNTMSHDNHNFIVALWLLYIVWSTGPHLLQKILTTKNTDCRIFYGICHGKMGVTVCDVIPNKWHHCRVFVVSGAIHMERVLLIIMNGQLSRDTISLGQACSNINRWNQSTDYCVLYVSPWVFVVGLGGGQHQQCLPTNSLTVSTGFSLTDKVCRVLTRLLGLQGSYSVYGGRPTSMFAN